MKSKIALIVASIFPVLAGIATGVSGTAASQDLVPEALDMAKLRAEDAMQEFKALQTEIDYFTNEAPGRERLEREALRPEALTPAGSTPCALVAIRTAALLKALQAMPGSPDLKAEQQELQGLTLESRTPTLSLKEQQALFVKLCDLRRRIAFKNPLLNFDRLLFLKRHAQARGDGHMVDQFHGFNAREGGGVYVLEQPFSEQPRVVNLLEQSVLGNGRLKGQKLDHGSFLSLELDFDAKTLAFAWTEAQHELPKDADWSQQPWTRREAEISGHPHYYWSPERTYHIFKVGADASGLTQLTDGPWNEYDPCFLPNGRIVFISERCGGNNRCSGRWSSTAVLHCMMPDGSDIVPLSYHETNEWQPSVTNDGMLVYTRWDYIDRASSGIHHIWTCYPDGRDPRSNHGNYPDWPWHRPDMEMGARAIPNSHKYLATAASHHGGLAQCGSLILIDPQIKDDRAMSQVKRVTPEVPLPESELNPAVPGNIPDVGQLRLKGGIKLPSRCYVTAWPLSEDFYLAGYDRNGQSHGVYLVDSFGNKVLVYKDPKIPCIDPMPFAPRPRPPVIPVGTKQMAADCHDPVDPYATISVLSVYKSEMPWPKDTKITALRVINLFPRDTPHKSIPAIGGNQVIARGVLGTVPVEEDGSAYFKIPSGVEVYFQALDERGRAVQTMLSGAYAHPGEMLSCAGCHESKHESPPNPDKPPLAMRRAPSNLKPEPVGSYPVSFPRLVQPVLDAKCISCHAPNRKAPNLSKELFPVDPRVTVNSPGNEGMSAIRGVLRQSQGWSYAYRSLFDYVWRKEAGSYRDNGFLRDHQYSIPGQIGARASKLYQILENGHHGVQLTEEEWRRLIVWMDANAVFYSAYHDLERQGKGELVMPHLGLPADWKERVNAEQKNP